MTDAFIGEIAFFAFNKLPDNWLPCDGRALNIQKNVALYSLLGITFGGNGSTEFNLPDLRGRTVVGYGNVRDVNHRVVNQPTWLQMGTAGAGGSETVALTVLQMPMHNHPFYFSTVNPPNSSAIANALLSTAQRGSGTPSAAANPPGVYTAPGTLVPINPASVVASGGGGSP